MAVEQMESASEVDNLNNPDLEKTSDDSKAVRRNYHTKKGQQEEQKQQP